MPGSSRSAEARKGRCVKRRSRLAVDLRSQREHCKCFRRPGGPEIHTQASQGLRFNVCPVATG